MILSIIITIILTILLYNYLGEETIICGSISLFCGGVIGFVLGFVVSAILSGCHIFPLEHDITTTPIYALKDDESIKGTRYIIRSTTTLKYVVNTDNGKHICQADIKECYINEDSEEPYVEYIQERYKYKWMSKVLFDLWGEKKYVFHVPSGTVTDEYDIDLE